jgi:hypothetical protein
VSQAWEAYYQSILPPLRARDISFWWRDCLKSVDTYKDMASCTLQNGRSILFWTDKWGQEILAQKWQFLFTYVKNVSHSVWDVFNTPNTVELFHLPLSVQAMEEYIDLLDLVLTTHLSQDKDNWTFAENGTGYKVSSAYMPLTKHDPVISAIKWLWKSCRQDKHRVFFWLLIHNRLNTRALLQRKNFFHE